MITTSIMASIAAAFLVVILRISIDRRHIGIARRTCRAATEYAATHDTSRIGIVIEARDSIEAIIPLLDHLYTLGDSNVDLFVILHETTEKGASTKLARYRREFHRNRLTTLKWSKTTTYRSLLSKRIDSEIVVRLSPTDRLSRDFFRSVRLAFLDHDLTALTPRRQICPDNTLASGLQASLSLWHNFYHQLYMPPSPRHILEPTLLYRRTYIVNPPKTIRTARTFKSYLKTAADISLLNHLLQLAYARKTSKASLLAGMVSLLLTTTAIIATIYFNNAVILYSLIATYVALYTLNQLSARGIAADVHISLLFLSPFAVILDQFITLLAPFVRKVDTNEALIEQ